MKTVVRGESLMASKKREIYNEVDLATEMSVGLGIFVF